MSSAGGPAGRKSPARIGRWKEKVSARGERSVEDLHGVQRRAAGAVVDLVATARSRRGEERVGRGGADGRKEHELADPHRDVEVLALVAERSGHAAAAAGNDLDGVVARQTEDHRDDGGRVSPPQYVRP